ncbi:MAG: hypothetical protein KDG44_00500 [Burkholderiaceae bacterium]|nr:hypothetical protein [Burkholderiaceae bacterium]
MRSLCLAAAALAICFGAAAQKIYRCGPDGRIYQQAPCTEGKAINAADDRTPEQRAAAQDLAASEARRAAQFDRDNAPASAPEGRKAKPPKAPPAAVAGGTGSAASAPKKGKPPAQDPSKPLTVRLPAKPKATTSAAPGASK